MDCRIVLENSGVAEPQNIRDLFAEEEAKGNPLLDRISLDTLVTVVGGSSYLLGFQQQLKQHDPAGSLQHQKRQQHKGCFEHNI
jgi:G3E family GTPase